MKPERKPENMLLSFLFNIIIPTGILLKASSEEFLGPKYALVTAIMFPLGYILWDVLVRRDYSIVSILGFINVLLTGGLGLMKVEGIWFALKEAAVPGVIGAAVLSSLTREKPLTYALLFNEKIFDIDKIKEKLQSPSEQSQFKDIMKLTTLLLAGSFFVSSILNFILGYLIIKSPSGSEAFNEELAHMQLLSYPVIMLPSMAVMGIALYKLFNGIKQLTGLSMEDIVIKKAK